ncbi:MAG: NAD-dependent epimerase/dehydratase family protein [Candidatus Paceibacterota bacterium]
MTTRQRFEKVLVIGANGYLGGHIVQEFVKQGNMQVFAGSRGQKDGVDFGDAVTPVTVDLLAGIVPRDLLANMDVVVFAAGRTWTPGTPPRAYVQANVGLTQRFFEELPRSESLRVLFTSSLSTVAGTTQRTALTEESGRQDVCERRLNPYDQAKRECERIALQQSDLGRDVVVLNPGFLIGPAADFGTNAAPPYATTWALTGKCPFIVDAALTFADVRDVARGYVFAMNHGRGSQRYILGGHDLLRSEFYEQLSEMTGVTAPRGVPNPVLTALATMTDAASWMSCGLIASPVHRSFAPSQSLHYCGDSAKAIRELGYTITPLAQTVADMLRQDVAAGRLPEHFSFLCEVPEAEWPEYLLLQQLVRQHHCRRSLTPKLLKLYSACRINHDLRAALKSLLETSRFAPYRGRFVWKNRASSRKHMAVLGQFFDYVYFSSAEFLESVQ